MNKTTRLKIKEMKQLYKANKEASVKSNCKCPSCGAFFIKGNYQQAFCKSKGKTKCKDYYWNNVTPTKRNNKTRISPASAMWMSRQGFNQRCLDDSHPFSPDALGQWLD